MHVLNAESKGTEHKRTRTRIHCMQLVPICMCMRLFGEIVGGANSIKFNSTYFSAWLRSQFVCMSVCMLSSCVCLNVKRSQNATHEVYGERCCLSGEPNKNLLQENCVSMYGTGGMATVCVLIGSFNNHPKWQTIGWIKYTCWLNYRCNVFTPTSHLHTRIHPYCVYVRHLPSEALRDARVCVCGWCFC